MLFFCTAATFLAGGAVAPTPQPRDSRTYELRVYTAAPGKLDDLHKRFHDHTIRLFRKHGLASIGYWVPVENKENRLYYIISAPSREARDRSFREMHEDPEFQTAFKASEANGKLVDKVESTFLRPTDYSPAARPSTSRSPRVFELRTYHTASGKLPDLNARFRNHTMRLFEKHGMKNIAYWTPMDEDQGAENTLVYLLAHKDQNGAKASWQAFGADPDWVHVKEESESNGKLVEKVESVYLTPTDYSPTR